MSELYIKMRKSHCFKLPVGYDIHIQINGFLKQVQIAYLAVMSNFERLVPLSYTLLSKQIGPLPSNAWHFNLRLINLISALMNSDV